MKAEAMILKGKKNGGNYLMFDLDGLTEIDIPRFQL